jgi:hypothetical protein
MKKYFAANFYLQVSFWVFVCLTLASIIFTFRGSPWSRNESTAVQSIEKIRRLQNRYAAEHDGKFAPNFSELVRAEYPELEEEFARKNPVVNGYVFSMTVLEPAIHLPAFFSITADPQVSEGITATGTLHFYFDSTLGTIKHTEENRPANVADPSI